MNHQHFRELLALSLYDELSQTERRQLDGHLETCQECRTELGQLKTFHLVAAQHPEPSTGSLQAARQSLRETLGREYSRPTSQPTFSSGRWGWLAAAALVIFALGLGSGAWLRRPSAPPQQAADPTVDRGLAGGEIEVANVRFVDPDSSDGQVEFTFDAVRPMRVKGSVSEAHIQKILTHAMLNEQNPGVRLRAVNALSAQQVRASDPEVKAALIRALQSDENPAVRKEAVTVLQKFPLDDDIKRAFLHVLQHDNNSALRIAAINGLAAARTEQRPADQQMLDVLRDTMNSDDNGYIRLRAKSVLEGVRQ
ncbi:MAG: HEAT repeat domain-containing protein [Acidobacteriota bacterium]